jgi:SPP1 gp7 family putative phage head morphogenesis protein
VGAEAKNGTHNGVTRTSTPEKRPLTPARKAMLRPFQGRTAELFASTNLAKDDGFGSVTRSLGSNLGGLFGLRPKLGGNEEITSPYHEVWVVWACVRWLAEAAASVRPVITVSGEPDAPEISPEHPIAKLFARPNDYTSWDQMADAAVVHRLLSGEDFWFLADDDGKPIKPTKAGLFRTLPTQILQFNGDVVGDDRDGGGLVTSWWYTALGSNQQLKFPRESVLHFRTYDPADPMRGTGPVEVLIRRLSLGFQIERYLEGGARAGGSGAFLTYDKSMGDEKERIDEEIGQRERNPDLGGRFPILDGPGKWGVIPVPQNPKDMQALDTLDKVEHVVCGTLGVAPPLVGIYGDAIFKNIEEGSRQSWLNVASRLKAIARSINAHFFDRCADPEIRRMRFGFDFSEIDALRVDETDRFGKAADIASKGVGVSFVEACESIGIEPAPTVGGKVELFSATLQSAEERAQAAAAASAAAEAAANAPAPAPVDGGTKQHALGPNPRFLRTIRPLEHAERREYHRQFVDRALSPFEKRLHRQAKGHLDSYGRAQLERLREFAAGTRAFATPVTKVSDDLARIIQELELDQQVWAKLLDSALGADIESIWRFGLADAAQEIGAISLPMTDPRVLSALAHQRILVSEGVTSTTARNVRDALLDVLRGSSSIGTLQERVREELPALTAELERVFGTNDARALNIARTETGHAANGARFAQFKAEGVKEIQWISAHDDVVRESHKELDGNVVALGAEFAPRLRFPHDPDASAAQSCNCRCTLLALIPE